MDSVAKIYEKHNLEKRGRNFLIFGDERKNILRKYVKGQGLKICDIGSRDGALTAEFIKGNEFWAVDFDKVALSFLKKKYKVKTIYQDLNADNWDLPLDYFDVVVFSEVLEHLYYPDKVLNKINKIMKPNAVLLGTVPNAFSFKNRLRLLFGNKKGTPLEDPTHINHFLYSELLGLLKKYFKNVEIVPLIQRRYRFLAKISPSLFSFMLFFKARKNER